MKRTILTMLAALSLMTFIGCEKEKELIVPTTAFTIVVGDVVQITVEPQIAGCTFTSNDETIATVSSAGIITGESIGTTTIIITKNKKSVDVKVTVKGRYNMYKEPYLGFGATPSVVKSKETRKLITENSKTIGYEGENSNIMAIIYQFENSLYKTSACAIPWSKKTLLQRFIGERYNLISADSSLSIFVNKEKTVIAAISYDTTEYLMVLYMDYNDIKLKNSNVSNTQLMELAKEQLSTMQNAL